MGHQKYLEKMFYENITFNNTKVFIRKSVHLNTEKALFILLYLFQSSNLLKSNKKTLQSNKNGFTNNLNAITGGKVFIYLFSNYALFSI